MNKVEEYKRLKEAISEIDLIDIVLVEDKGIDIPFGQTVPRNKYLIEFSSSYRGLLLTGDLVKKAITENLGRIQESMRHWARQWIDDKKVEAIQEVDDVFEDITGEKMFSKLEDLGTRGSDMEGHEVTLELNKIIHPELYSKS